MLLFMLSAMLLLTCFEALFSLRSDWKPTRSDFVRGAFVYLAGHVSEFAAIVIVYLLASLSQTWAREGITVLELIFGLFVADYAFYWLHRVSHHLKLFKWHAWHHQPTRLNTLITHVGHPFFIWAVVFVRLLPCVLLGISAEAITLIGVIQVVVSWWGHMNTSISFRWLSWFLVTPEVHQWHHAPGARVNYGLVFSFWDRLHKTFQLPVESRVKRVGVKPGEYPDEFDYVGQFFLERRV